MDAKKKHNALTMDLSELARIVRAEPVVVLARPVLALLATGFGASFEGSVDRSRRCR